MSKVLTHKGLTCSVLQDEEAGVAYIGVDVDGAFQQLAVVKLGGLLADIAEAAAGQAVTKSSDE